MKLSHTILGTAAALALTTSGGCIFIGSNAGDVQFDYVLLFNDNGETVAVSDCAELGVAEVRMLFGTDFNNNGTLEDNEVEDQDTDFCNQFDADGNGFVDQGEFGQFNGVIFSGFYDLFAVEFINDAGISLGWQTFDINQDFVRFSFGGGINITGGATNIIPFDGDQFQTSSEELQVFFNF